MPFPKTGTCPFTGGHWPQQWGEQKITPKTFSSLSLNSDQRKDLIEYFFEHESAQTSARPRPAYRFPLNHLRDYFGVDAKDVRRAVQRSQEYKDYVDAHQRSQAPPPPPEMSLLTAARIAACLAMEPPEEDEGTRRARGYARDSERRKSASAAQVVRRAEREAAGIITTNGLPRNDGVYKEVGSRSQHSFDFESDPTRVIVCDMQTSINKAADESIRNGVQTRKAIFDRLVGEEERKEAAKGKPNLTGVRAPYKTRAALGLILLLSSTLW
jgi:uncharacterized protein (UPF0254 family)